MHSVIKQLEQKYKCPIWISRNGSLTPLVLMSDSHLKRCIDHVASQLASVPWGLQFMSDAPEDMQYRPQEMGAEDFIEKAARFRKWQDALKKEAERRQW